MATQNMRFCAVAVHAGAGYHSSEKEKDYKLICSSACKKAMVKLKDGASALEVVTTAIQCLEDSALTNAGVGSSLTVEGTVECDASVMDGKTLLFGAVGALSNIQNPIEVAAKLVEGQMVGVLPLGRIPPCILVGDGARIWANEHGIQSVSDSALKSESAVKTFKNHKRRLVEAQDRVKLKRRKHLQITTKSESTTCKSNIQDTVGAVCIDMEGNMAAGASSGGISLKQLGRLGPAAVYGAGCWAYNWKSVKKPGVAVATSGAGEHIIKTLLAKTCADTLQREEIPTKALQTTFQEHFLESDFLDQTKERFGGILALKHDKRTADVDESNGDVESQTVELLWGHTTDSMCIGYMTSSQTKPKTIVTRQEGQGKAGHTYLLQGQYFST